MKKQRLVYTFVYIVLASAVLLGTRLRSSVRSTIITNQRDQGWFSPRWALLRP